ncbi:hypothetical protein A9G43_09650 [Gilliamella sp. Occ3-1]|uniref:hypothetical protein n=1 Tax=Gilliamella sp. Occ3-1 TaxID=3120253 RepID=UPI00080E0480|nr:hypothetical protein [Gilliamella apicola]OCG69861.1 hypothetical protein A9G43_09650 [Gilliamella apicola]
MKLIISVILILTSCFVNATDLDYNSERMRLYQLTKKFEAKKHYLGDAERDKSRSASIKLLIDNRIKVIKKYLHCDAN